LVSAFGKERLMWGTDWPWVQEQEGGYANAWKIIESGDSNKESSSRSSSLLTQEEKEFVYGKTAISLFPKLS
jgi:predicted TIM-barrel fold metal-dependent hydrolase